MNCHEAEHLVMPYINNELTDEELELFLHHIKSCDECREELEIYFTVDVGIKQLDSETGNYNIKGALELALEQSSHRLHTVRLIKIARYAVTTLCVMSILTMVLLQCRLWLQYGIL